MSIVNGIFMADPLSGAGYVSKTSKKLGGAVKIAGSNPKKTMRKSAGVNLAGSVNMAGAVDMAGAARLSLLQKAERIKKKLLNTCLIIVSFINGDEGVKKTSFNAAVKRFTLEMVEVDNYEIEFTQGEISLIEEASNVVLNQNKASKKSTDKVFNDVSNFIEAASKGFNEIATQYFAEKYQLSSYNMQQMFDIVLQTLSSKTFINKIVKVLKTSPVLKQFAKINDDIEQSAKKSAKKRTKPKVPDTEDKPQKKTRSRRKTAEVEDTRIIITKPVKK